MPIVSRITDKSILSDLTIWRDVVGRINVALVDLALGDELVDVDGPRAFNLNGIELLVLDWTGNEGRCSVALGFIQALQIKLSNGGPWDFSKKEAA